MVLLICLTPTGRVSRRNVQGHLLHETIRRLEKKGYSGFRAL